MLPYILFLFIMVFQRDGGVGAGQMWRVTCGRHFISVNKKKTQPYLITFSIVNSLPPINNIFCFGSVCELFNMFKAVIMNKMSV